VRPVIHSYTDGGMMCQNCIESAEEYQRIVGEKTAEFVKIKTPLFKKIKTCDLEMLDRNIKEYHRIVDPLEKELEELEISEREKHCTNLDNCKGE